MDFVDWRLLWVVAVFGAGWAIARVDMEQVVSKARGIPERVMAGISSLLRKDRAAAAASFLAAGQPLEYNNIELHFIAGELYRQLGDHEAAIKIHKSILASAELDDQALVRARYELGLDYHKGGFLDLAEKCFSQLEGTNYADQSLRHLFNIQLYSSSWQRAIEDEERFVRKGANAELRRHVIAQLYCEWAAESAPERKEELLVEALRRNPVCGRAWIMRAELELEQDKPIAALVTLENLHQHPAYIPIAANLMMRAHLAANQVAAGEQFLIAMCDRYPSVIMFAKVYDALAETRGPGELGPFIARHMGTLKGSVLVAKWLTTACTQAQGDLQRSYNDLLHCLGNVNATYSCSECNFEATNHYWQCPICLVWESMLPEFSPPKVT